MFKNFLNGLVDHPLLTTLLVCDFFVLLLHKPPFIFSLLLLGFLVGVCLFLGQKLALFKI